MRIRSTFLVAAVAAVIIAPVAAVSGVQASARPISLAPTTLHPGMPGPDGTVPTAWVEKSGGVAPNSASITPSETIIG